MSKLGKYSLILIVGAAIFTLAACGEEAPPPASKAPIVKKKISARKPASSTKSAGTEAAVKTDAGGAAAAAKPEGEGSAKAPGSEEASALIEASLKIASSYNPEGRFDPFEPLFKEEPATPPVIDKERKRDKREPQTPLERVALGQLKLSAIMRTSKGNRAIVEDATGKGYVIKKGTYIGLNSGQVILIEKARVVVEEEIENVLGELTIQSTELKLQKPAGEL